MARTKDQSFVNRYLNQYQSNQQAAVSAGQQAASSAANSGVSTMTQAAQNTNIPSLYDYAPDLMQMAVDQQEAQIKAQQAAAKAAQKQAEDQAAALEKARKEKAQEQKKALQSRQDAIDKAKENAELVGQTYMGGTASPSYYGPVWEGEVGASAPVMGNIPNTEYNENLTLPEVESDWVWTGHKWERESDMTDDQRAQHIQDMLANLNYQDTQNGKKESVSYDDAMLAYSTAAKNAQEISAQRAELEKEREKIANKVNDVGNRTAADISRFDAVVKELESLDSQEAEANANADTAMKAVKAAIKELPEAQRLQAYMQPGYTMDKEEKSDAKAIMDSTIEQVPGLLWEEYAASHPAQAKQIQEGKSGFWVYGLSDKYRGQPIAEIYNSYKTMSDAEKQLGKSLSLFNSGETGAALAAYAGFLSASPAFTDLADNANSATMQYLGMDGSVKPSEYFSNLQQNNPLAYGAGAIGGTLAEYAAGAKLMQSIPRVGAGLQKAGQALGGTSVAQRLSKMPILGAAFTPAAITDILGDQAVDTVLDTGVGAARSAMQGEDAAQIAQDAAASFGGNLAANIVSAGVLGTAGDWLAQRRAARQAANAAQDAPLPTLDDAARQAAENVQEAPSASAGNAVPNVATYADTTIADSAPPTLPENLLVEKWRSGTLTNADIETLKPGGENRAAFEAETGVQLPSTSKETRRFLRNVPMGSVGTAENLRRFADEVDNVFKGNSRYDSPLVLGDTPQLYKELGAQPLNITIEPKTLYKIAYPEGYMQGKHNLGIPALKQLPTQIENPVAVLKSASQPNSFVILTEWADTSGRPVIVPLHLNKNGAVSLENRLASAYGHKHIDTILGENNSNVLWTKGNEDIGQLLSQRLQLPKAVVDDTLVSNYSIPGLQRDVNAAVDDNLPPQSIGAMRHDPTSYSSMQNTYGTIAPGENPARVVDVPVSTNGTDRVGAGIRTIMEAPQTSDELVQLFEDGVRDGIFSHTVASDKKAFDTAVSYVENAGYKDALANWDGMIKKGKRLDKNDIIQGQLLYSLAAQNGDMETAKRLATDLVQIATESGQNLQAQRMLKRMTPEGRLYYAQTTVERLNKQLKDRFGDKFKDIVLDNALLENLKNANTEQAQREAMDAIYQNVANQMPATWAGRWNAWRYLSMLFNPATHVRNVVSNAINVPARQLKNIIGAGIERVALKEGDRTKAILLPWDAADQRLVQFAKSDIENVMDELTGAQKYSDKSVIMQMADPFKINGTWGTAADSSAVATGARKVADAISGTVSKLYKTNSWALGAEDMLFKKSAYADSLAQYLKANNIDPAAATVKQLDAARKYAIEEALRATNTEYNSLATTLSQLERKYKAASIGFGGLIPFKSTPMNIIRRGLRYSPVGLAESFVRLANELRKGNTPTTQLIDNLAQGLSGTSIFGLGAFMGYMGWINGIGAENAKESAWQNSQGWQTYSINLPGGGTYTIDWGGPSVMALLAGAETAKAFQEEGADFNDFFTALLNITEPVFDTTMLSGINSAIQSAVYSEANPITAAAMQAVTNYVTQGIPSVFGAVARAADPIRRTTYSDAGGALGGIEKTMQRTGNKLPSISSENQPYIDVWGREQENPGGNFVGRLAYNFLSPGYYSPDRSNEADALVGDLYEQTGESSVLPGLYPSTITVDGESQRLSPEDYTLAKQTKGQASLDILQTLSGYEQYNSLTPAEQQKIVEDVYSTASDLAKLQVVPSLMDEFEEDSRSGDLSKSEWFMYLYQNEGADAVVPYLVADEIIANVYGDKNAKGNTIPGSSRKNKLAALVAKGFTSAEAEEILDRIG